MRLTLVFLALLSICHAKPSMQSMISQMLMIGFSGQSSSEQSVKELKKDLAQDKLGGVLFLQRNVGSKTQLTKLISYLKDANTSLPTLMAIDQEGGFVTRFSKENGFKTYPTARNVCANSTLDEAKSVYLQMAQELKEIGINYNLAPVVDVLINPTKFERQRCFSKFSSIVSTYASSFVNGFDEAKVLTSLKHFPGYASAISDAHEGLVDVSLSWKYDELRPYYDLIKAKKAKSIMVSHMFLKQFDKFYPASLSQKIIKGILRDTLKYDGVVISDDLSMKSLDGFSMEERIVKSINAGVDIMIFSDYTIEKKKSIDEIRNLILQAIKNGKIKKENVEKSYERIVKFKAFLK